MPIPHSLRSLVKDLYVDCEDGETLVKDSSDPAGVVPGSGGGGGNPFDQDLNTDDPVEFTSVLTSLVSAEAASSLTVKVGAIEAFHVAEGDYPSTAKTVFPIPSGAGPAYDGTLLVETGNLLGWGGQTGAMIQTAKVSDADSPSLQIGTRGSGGDNYAMITFLSATDAAYGSSYLAFGPKDGDDIFSMVYNNTTPDLTPMFAPGLAAGDGVVDLGTLDAIGGGEIGSLGPLRFRNGYFSGTVQVGTLKGTAIPTSSAGLVSGDIWANSNVLTIVP